MARYESSRRKELPKSSPKPASDALRSRPFAANSENVESSVSATAHPNREGQAPQVPTLVSFNRPQPIQPKLTIGAPGDKYEQEADRVASQVVRHINSPSTNQAQAVQRETMPEEDELQMKPMLQRETMPEEEDELQMKSASLGGIVEGEASPNLETSIQHARGSGQALTPDLQAKMGQAMEADFSGVRIHTDSQSDQLNRSIQAKAFTTGQDIFFRQGAYQPGSRGGQELIAHELTHVVQQNGTTLRRQVDAEETKSRHSNHDNHTGIPNALKSGLEELSGFDLSEVRVHYNSGKPQHLNSLAYTQGQDIYVAPGQEQHLPHEAWHVIQQKQGRVNPTTTVKNAAINDDKSLEKEADRMGSQALSYSPSMDSSALPKHTRNTSEAPLQRVIQLLRFDAGVGNAWHIHFGHIKCGNNDNSRVEFNGRDKKAIRKELGEKIARFGLNVNAAGFRECINYINTHC